MTPQDVLLQIELPGVEVFRRGKVRDVFDLDDRLLIVASDRVSAFDVILPQGIPGKGAVLNQISRFWFERLADVVPNHCITTDVAQYPEPLRSHAAILAERSMLVRKTEVVPFECVVRGYLAGSGYKEYQKSGGVCGHQLPPGLRLADRLPRPIFTPSTKVDDGHDENITRDQLAEGVGAELASRLEELSLKLYNTAAAYALERGIVIADTKFEFGHADGQLLLIDEAFTPDSSRFWRSGEFEPGHSPKSFDKQIVRDHLEASGWSKRPPAPDLPPEIIARAAQRYREIYEILTN